ncbi:Serpin domain containing protein [Asbolus verrucosus]|uniref:Serpin domain containing protein n=1 Tax=Asbolus verrucosus TaxID=1661398 RepID=A0A482W403_ASBVE|nr:Serpin domain containing protein [Asbolus verrucosus]
MNVVLILLLAVTSSLSHEAKTFTSVSNQFTAATYKEIAKDVEGNFLVSPFSAAIILALAQTGARGATAQELRTGLRFPEGQDEIESSIEAVTSSVGNNREYALQSANKMYLQENYQIKDEFRKVATDAFYADIENIDFSRNAEAAKVMNRWVEEHTEKKIRDLITSNDVGEDTKLILINALYFQGNWSKQFKRVYTQQDAFYQNGENVVQVATMHDHHGYYKYCENGELNAKFLEIPFEGGDVSMVFVLPNEKKGLASLENQIEKVLLPQDFVKETVNVSLPKFKIESKLDFKEILKNLGVVKAFNREADFSGISDEKLVISKILQKAFINVTEEGVEAAAATYLGEIYFVPFSAHILLSPPKFFIADHPFLYYIKFRDVIIFAGRLSSP